jgi:hypothetical protein
VGRTRVECKSLEGLWSDWDWSGTEAELKQTIELNPNFADAHFGCSVHLVIMERLDEAVHESERARDLDPFDFNDNEWLGQAPTMPVGTTTRCVRFSGLWKFPDRGEHLYRQIAGVYEQKKMFAEAFAARQQHGLILNKDPNVTALGEAYKRAPQTGHFPLSPTPGRHGRRRSSCHDLP